MLKKIAISTRILLLVYVFLSLMTFGFGFGLTRFGHLGQEVRLLSEKNIPLSNAVTEITMLQLEQAMSFQRAIRFGGLMSIDDTAKQSFEEASANFHKLESRIHSNITKSALIINTITESLNDQNTNPFLPNALNHLEQIRIEHENYKNQVNNVFKKIRNGKFATIKNKAQTIENSENRLVKDIAKFLKQIENFTSTTILNINSNNDITSSFMTSISAVSMCIAILLSLIVSRSIITPLKTAVGIARKISSGERDIQFKITTKDEVAEFLTAMNETLIALRQAQDDLKNANLELEDKVRERTAELSHSNRELESFASVVAHDLKSPLFKVQMLADTVNKFYTSNLDPKAQEFLSKMKSALLRMQNLIDALLEYSVITKKEKAPTEVELNDVLQDVMADLETYIAAKQAEVNIEPLPVVEGNATLLRQLFQNLISNAVKYSQDDAPPKITITAKSVVQSITSGKMHNFFEISIKDNGIGFEEEYALAIFNPFQRLHTDDNYGGLGIGLATCRKIVEYHGGEISATSCPGKGSTFKVLLPTKQTVELKSAS